MFAPCCPESILLIVSPFSDFEETADIYKNTATEMQNVLASVTPPTPIFPSLAADFNNWLRNTISVYPDGCMSAIRAEEFYPSLTLNPGAEQTMYTSITSEDSKP